MRVYTPARERKEESILTSDVSEVNGLSVRVEELDDGVVVVFHPAADGGRFTLDHRHVCRHQVLTLHCTAKAREHTTFIQHSAFQDSCIFQTDSLRLGSRLTSWITTRANIKCDMH